jgi:hypothetical protein
MKIRGLFVVGAIITVIGLAGCASKAGAEQNTNPPVTTPPATTTLVPTTSTGSTSYPVLAAYNICTNCHGSVPDKAPPISHYKVDGD